MKFNYLLSAALLCASATAFGQANIREANQTSANPDNAEKFEPIPAVVTPAKTLGAAPSDAIVLFDGKNLNEWLAGNGKDQAGWKIDKDILTVDKSKGDIQTKKSFGNFQLHIEWKIPEGITQTGQMKGNSGIFLQGQYELQVLDTYNNENKTYTNGMAASIYREATPLVNPARKAGEWNVYDIAYTQPEWNEDGTVKTPARVTVFFNGVMVQNNQEIRGFTSTGSKHVYRKHGVGPLKLQSHGDPSPPISYRNIWIRES
ncbi:3-keto-disaccharide hydrolase [Mucilaginibacter myungsuensis]|uniref:DUF1080 domain-containing protein n=1 Tax=Mucilaginibacter myungsuensis TaxID=649104 RepID=A0A929PW11_9SPHI|nr:DUF1080 domain-containing protein [Mucilaginibacter myungsuensis]MBE9662343.1 DUF1080 domain-containing protein [Mucilaginibacter myungsuensis]MDN3599220.1 DUF1080 domain-containing protein [Mucilaginibacter myungsuensis]